VARILEENTPRLVAVPVSDPEEALELVSAEPFDCIVSDFEMPRVDGFELLGHVRAINPTVPFILYTAVSATEILEEALDRGVTEFLQKGGPDQFAILGRAVTDAIEATQRDPVNPNTEAMFVVSADGSIEAISEPFLELTGYEASDLLGDSWEVLFPAVEVKRLLEVALPTVASEGSWSGESLHVDKDGTEHHDATSIEAIEDGSLFILVVDLDDLGVQLEERARRTAGRDAGEDGGPTPVE
jgi:PAS domain S-box-containing protein